MYTYNAPYTTLLLRDDICTNAFNVKRFLSTTLLLPLKNNKTIINATPFKLL